MAKKTEKTNPYAAKLKAAQKAWGSTEPNAGSGDWYNGNVAEGRYKAKPVEKQWSEMGSKPVLVLSFEIMDDDCEGERVHQRYGFETKQLGILMRDLKSFGVEDPSELDLSEDLDTTVDAIIEAEPICKIMVKEKDGFQNVYLTRVEEMTVSEDEEEEAEEEEEVEIEEGDEVTWSNGKRSGTVTVVKDGKATVKDDADKKVVVALDKLTKVEVEEEEEEVEEEEAEEETKPKPKAGAGGKKPPKKPKAEEAEEEEGGDDEETVELKKGMKVVVPYQKKDADGKVVSIDEESETVKVKLTKFDGKVIKVSVADVEVV